jgi:hypothetical protein
MPSSPDFPEHDPELSAIFEEARLSLPKAEAEMDARLRHRRMLEHRRTAINLTNASLAFWGL